MTAENTPEGTVWRYFLCAPEMAKFQALIRELRNSLFEGDQYDPNVLLTVNCDHSGGRC